MNKIALAIAASLGLGACAATPPVATTVTQPPTANVAGLERVMGQSAAGLVALFGEPAQDFREETARKLQFASGACVLDTYLYAGGSGGEPVVTHIDARSPVGEDVDRVACVEALTRR